MTWLIVALAAWTALTLKKSRPDGTYLEVPTYRRGMFHIMPKRNESVVYFDRVIRAERLTAYLEQAKDRFHGNMTHAVVAAINIGLAENPRMNQFVAGRRMYARNGRYITFSMKRVKKNKEAKLAAVKLRMTDGETFRELCERINGGIKHQRSGEKTAADQEHDLFAKFPRPVYELLVWFVWTLDYYNLVPGFFIEQDEMYTSSFVANLGSVDMAPGYHHLYEHGTCPLFLMVGAAEDTPVIEDGKVVVGRTLRIRFSYDERIADGLTARGGIETVARVLEDPERWLGCLEEDGSDTHPMWPHGMDPAA